LCTLEGN
jgi:hypothetical protein